MKSFDFVHRSRGFLSGAQSNPGHPAAFCPNEAPKPPSLVAGTPEARQYQAQYLNGDDLVGQLSDILNITVPG